MRSLFPRIHLYLVLVGLTLLVACIPIHNTIQGRVVDENGDPLAAALVRVKATLLETATGEDGSFSLAGVPVYRECFVTAWLSGYYINGVDNVKPGYQDVEIILHAHHDTDNPDYMWMPSTDLVPDAENSGENQACSACHSRVGSQIDLDLPVDEWLLDAHSQSARNQRFVSMYNGTDLEGNQSPLTIYGYSQDYGRFPLPPDPHQAYFGPGYKLDFPETDGNCSACHTPAAAVDAAYGTDPTSVNGVAAEGMPCDFCHKVWNVNLDPASGLPHANTPGVLSYEFRRPPQGHQFFAGPLDDVAPGEDTYSSVQNESRYCAPCHFGVFWDTVVYNSFGEWLDSPYSEPETGKTCQDCHMPHVGATYFVRPEQGGVERDPETIFSHRMPGAADDSLLQNAVTLKVTARREDELILVEVNIINDLSGHHVPTDSPLRQMILLVKASGANSEGLKLESGPTLPDWTGIGDPYRGYYAGLPGQAYAKILMELWTEVAPSGAYWNPTRIVSDNRIPAQGSDTSQYVFRAPVKGNVRIEASLIFRRAFITLSDQKGWDVPDILMESQTLELEFP